MRPVDHFFSELDAAKRRAVSSSDVADSLSRSFGQLVVPLLGEDLSEECFRHWADRYGSGVDLRFEVLGYIAAFVLGEYDDATMDLDGDDWTFIRDALSNAADELDMDTLSQLMTDLVSRGALD